MLNPILFLRTTALAFVIFLVSMKGFSQTRIKAMVYNLLNYSNDGTSQQKTPFLQTILQELSPDLLVVCELESESGSDYLFNNAIVPLNPDFQKAVYEPNQSGNSNLQQMVYYNSKKLVLENSRVILADTRDINQYTFRLNNENSSSNPILIQVFVTHLKAATGLTNRQRRWSSINNFVDELGDLDPNSYVIFAGDFNFYTSNEEGYQALVNPNNPIVMLDPIDRPAEPFDPDEYLTQDPYEFYEEDSDHFWRNSSFADIHTQSTRITNSGMVDTSGSIGGMDDRFDFIMMSENFSINTDLYYVSDSYQSIGNNGNCYNSFINNTDCGGIYSQNLRDALIEFSDHAPVVMEIETTENVLSTENYVEAFGILGSNLVHTSLSLSINFNSSIRNLNIYNTNGQLIKSIELYNPTDNTVTVNVENLSQGIYYLSSQNLNTPLKFVKI